MEQEIEKIKAEYEEKMKKKKEKEKDKKDKDRKDKAKKDEEEQAEKEKSDKVHLHRLSTQLTWLTVASLDQRDHIQECNPSSRRGSTHLRTAEV